MAESKLTVAIQKNGRLNDESLRLLLPDGLATKTDQQLYCNNPDLPIDIIFVRDDDIPLLVAEEVCDLGIVGHNVLLERKIEFESSVTRRIKKLEIIEYLGFGNCRLSFAVPEDFSYTNLISLNDCRIATSYPYLVKKFLVENDLYANIIYLSGSVEIAPRLNIADIICDLVVTGSTLQQNNLREVYSILSSEAILFRSATLSVKKQEILNLWLQQLGREGESNA